MAFYCAKGGEDINPYKDKRWIKKRQNILRRDKYECVNCKRFGKITLAVTVHHIYFLKHYPKLWLYSWNLISLCNDCHNKMHNRVTDEPTPLGVYWQTKFKREFNQTKPPYLI